MPEAIIESILDTDLYKLTMQQAVIREFPGIDVRYDLIIRTPREFRATFAEELKEQIFKDIAAARHMLSDPETFIYTCKT